ncbi:MAG TPA: aldose 1-epimerase family protein [Flavitalea sp.]|nr:aldose 1-epimerase family protein [Flavitalea sp.]
MDLTALNWNNKIGNTAQLGGIETSILDNGAGKGVRIAWVNTGAGLRYKVVIDRAMDIADAFYNQYSLSYLSHAGITRPQPSSNRGTEWLRTFGGGLLVTCGLEHTGGPESDGFGERGLHGLISNIPAEIESIIQPDPVAGKMNMSITGRIRQSQALGAMLELRRTISGTLGKPGIAIHDEVINCGNAASPCMLLYHFNFGWPLVDQGTHILWKGKWKPRGEETIAGIFREGNDFRTCPDPLDAHNGTGEDVAFIDPDSDESGTCFCGLHNEKIGLAVTLSFQKEQLPWLVNWQHWAKNEYVTGLEPASCLPIGQAALRKRGALPFIGPGERKTYQLRLEVLDEQDAIQALKKKQFTN